MKTVILASAFALAGVVGLATPGAQAANARHPYANADHRNDKGNNTGDDQVERLNSMLLDLARAGAGASPMMGGQGNMPMGAAGTMPMNGSMGTTPMSGGMGTTPMSGGMGTTPMSGSMGTTPMSGGMGTTPMTGRPGATPTR